MSGNSWRRSLCFAATCDNNHPYCGHPTLDNRGRPQRRRAQTPPPINRILLTYALPHFQWRPLVGFLEEEKEIVDQGNKINHFRMNTDFSKQRGKNSRP